MSNHTPGPWTVRHSPNDYTEIMAESETLMLARSEYATDEDEQNFTLMAAAPEMYDVLCKLIYAPEYEIKNIIEQAKDAVCKAEGKK